MEGTSLFSEWHLWGGIDALPAGTLKEVAVDGKILCLLRRDERVFAFAATCPHAGAHFCEGWLSANGQLVCPLHKYRFDPANGRNTSGEGYKLMTFPAEIRDQQIFIKF